MAEPFRCWFLFPVPHLNVLRGISSRPNIFVKKYYLLVVCHMVVALIKIFNFSRKTSQVYLIYSSNVKND